MRTMTEITPAEQADRLAIRQLVDAYAHCADRRLVEEQKSLRPSWRTRTLDGYQAMATSA